jgi:hypothetical protein
MTVKPLRHFLNMTIKYKTIYDHTKDMAAANTGLAKVAVQCFYDSFVGKQTVVHLINICGENRHLRQARKRYRSC